MSKESQVIGLSQRVLCLFHNTSLHIMKDKKLLNGYKSLSYQRICKGP
jgi:hypothetical protein